MKNTDTKNTELINISWFAYSFALTKKQRTNFNTTVKTWCELNEVNYNCPFFSVADNVVSWSNVDLLKKLQSSYLVLNEDKSSITRKIDAFFYSFIKGVKHGIKLHIIKNVKLFAPFIRLSLIDHSLIYTHFILIDYFNDYSEFIVFEEVPDIYNITKDINTVVEYAKGAICQVRKSTFSHLYYRYLYTDELRANNEIHINYCLLDFVMVNFSCDLRYNINCKKNSLYICSNNDLTIARNKNKKIKFSVCDGNLYRVGVKTFKNYDSYLKKSIEAIFYYMSYVYVESYLIKMSKKENMRKCDRDSILLDIALKGIKGLAKVKKITTDVIVNRMVKIHNNSKWIAAYQDITRPGWEALVAKFLGE